MQVLHIENRALGFIVPLLLKSETELCKLKLGWDNDIPIMYLRKL